MDEVSGMGSKPTAAGTSTRERDGRALEELATLAVGAATTVLVMFLIWEVIEQQWAHSDDIAHLMHYARGISSSLVTAAVIGWVSWRQHRRRAQRLEEEVDRRTVELADAQAFLQLVVDTTPASLMVLDSDLNVVQANRAAERVHGKSLGRPHLLREPGRTHRGM